MTVDFEDWIPSSLNRLRRAVQVALSLKSHAPHRDLLERVLDQTQSALSNDIPGREAFRTLLREIVYHMSFDSQIGISERLPTFHVASGIAYDIFCR